MIRKRKCSIQKTVKIICPLCGTMIDIPMFKAINGEEILCQHCQKIIKFAYK